MCSATLSRLVFWGTGLGTWLLCEDVFSYKDEEGLFCSLGWWLEMTASIDPRAGWKITVALYFVVILCVP